MRDLSRLVLMAAALFGIGCADGPTAVGREARVVMSFLTPATVRTVVVEVSGPGLSPAVVVNVPVGADSTARDTLVLTAGAGRRFVVTALDSAGVTTHRADTTITLQAGVNAPLALRLDPLSTTLGIAVTFGGYRLTLPDTTSRSLEVWDSLVVTAQAFGSRGEELSPDSIVWASTNPAILTVERGLVRAVRAGEASVVASVNAAAASIRVRVIDSSTTGIRLTAVGPAGAGVFLVAVDGSAGTPSDWRVLRTSGDSVRAVIDLPEAGSYRLRLFAIDKRTDPATTLGGWSRLLGTAVHESVIVAAERRTAVRLVASHVSIGPVDAPEEVPSFTEAQVTWDLVDSTGLVQEFGNHHLNYALESWPDVGCSATQCGGIGPNRRDASTVEIDGVRSRYAAVVPAQDLSGQRVWRVVHWQETPVGIIAMLSPSTVNGESLRILRVTPQSQTLEMRMRGPVGTGTFFAKVSGGGLTAPIWRRVTVAQGDSAAIVQELPVGGPYRVRVFAIDARTDPRQTLGGWSIVRGIAERQDVFVQASQDVTLALEAVPVAIQSLSAPDTVRVGEPISISWTVSDSTDAVAEFGNHHIGFDATLWPDVGCSEVQCGGIGPNRQEASRVRLSDGRYRYTATIPPQVTAGRLEWKINHWQEVGPLEGGGILAMFAPSTVAGDAPRPIIVLP